MDPKPAKNVYLQSTDPVAEKSLKSLIQRFKINQKRFENADSNNCDYKAFFAQF